MGIAQLDTAALRERFRNAQPFPFVVIDGFLEPEFALRVARAYPSYAEAEKLGRSFTAVNEYRKVQITDPARFPAAVGELAACLSSRDFLTELSAITGIGDLLWDASFAGGGMHQTGNHGLLDVHVDFNRLSETGAYRRLNLLLYLNEVWKPEWGGDLELWDRGVKVCRHSVAPVLNRCVIFETSEHSFHGVKAVAGPADVVRNSFAIYCYTEQPPAGHSGASHDTIFKARPNEHLKRQVLMPAQRLENQLKAGVRWAKRRVKKLIGRD